MYNIISYEKSNEFYISTLNNYFSEDLNSVKKDIKNFTYLLIIEKNICGIFSYKYNIDKIEIVLLKVSNILDYYIDNFIFIIFNNIILEFDYIYINKCKLQPSNIILNELYNYDLINNSNDMILIYKKKHKYNYFNCLFY
tara:strand:+ start:1377 stop:1796 length:420 start_codon:yes stop_codon:yes gene_type:complete